MQNIYIKLLEKLRQRYIQKHGIPQYYNPCKEIDPNIISNRIRENLSSSKPCMFSRFGSVEIGCVINYLGIFHQKKRYYKIHKGRGIPLVVEKGNDTYYEK